MSEAKIAEKRLSIIKLADEIGLQQAAEIYKCSTRTILRWKKRYRQDGSTGLSNRAKSGLNQPNRLSDELTARIIALKQADPQLTASEIRERLGCEKPSLSAVYKKLQQAGFGTFSGEKNKSKAVDQGESQAAEIVSLRAQIERMQDKQLPEILAVPVFKLCDLLLKQDKTAFQVTELLSFIKQKAEESHNINLLYEIWGRQALVQERQKDYSGAMISYQEQRKWAAKLRSYPEKEASALLNLGYCAALLNHQIEAIDYFIEAGKKAAAAKKNDLAAKIYNNLGICYQEINELGKAQENFRMAYQLSGNQGDRQLFLTNLAMAYQASGKVTDLEGFLKDELVYFRKRKDKSGELMALTTLQMYSFESGNYELALTCFKDTIELAEELNRPEVIARSCHYISQFYLETGNMEQAFNYINRAIMLALQYDSINDVIEFKVFLLLLLYLKRDYDRVVSDSRDVNLLIESRKDSHDSQALLNVIMIFADLRLVLADKPVEVSEIRRMLNIIFSFKWHHTSTPIELLVGYLMSEILFEYKRSNLFPAHVTINDNSISLATVDFIKQTIFEMNEYLSNCQHSLFAYLTRQLQKFAKEL